MENISQAVPKPIAAARPSPTAVALGVWALLIVGCAIWGELLLSGGTRLFIDAPPLFGSWQARVTPGVVAAVGVAAAIILVGPRLARELDWRRLSAAVFGAAVAWPLALALVAGPDAITSGLDNPHDYLIGVSAVHSPVDYLSTFIDRIDSFSTHVSGHPPAMVLILAGLNSIGLGGSAPAAVLILAVAASAPVAVMIATRAVAGEGAARRAAPFLVLAPAAVWIATSADALYMGVGAWAVALLTLALVERRRGRSNALAVAGGLTFGLVCFLSFGLILLAAVPIAVAIGRRRVRPLLVGGAGASAVALAFLGAGYWWLDGLAAARGQYYDGVAAVRPLGYFLFADLAAFAIATGPALAVGLANLRDRRLLILVGGAAAAIALADLSAMSKGEVERIWLPFVPWMLVATAALPQSRGGQRALLGAQAACALAVQIAVATTW